MSSDEEGASTSPVLPRDSDRGSSVSSELQGEYEELHRYAVVTPKFELGTQRQALSASQLTADGRISSLMDDVLLQNSAEQDKSRHELPSDRQLGTSRVTTEGRPAAAMERMEGQGVLLRTPVESDVESGSNLHSPAHSVKTSSVSILPSTSDYNVIMELFIPEENMNKMEHSLDTWSNQLKTNVITELRKWKLAVIEQHRLQMKNEKEKHAAHVARLTNDMDDLKELLHTYEISNQRKDEVISNLMHGMERLREKQELMRTFSHWRSKQCEAREEAYSNGLADRHYKQMLMKKVWVAWHSVIEVKWRERVERACQARAEEVCLQLSTDYERKIEELSEALEKARCEIQQLHSERERYEESMKKAFMRGVCALNMEAMTMFNGREEHPSRREEPGSSISVNFQQPAATSASFSPVHFESAPATAAPSDTEQMFTSHFGSVSAPARTAEDISATTTVDGTTKPSTHKLSVTRVVTAAQQRAEKTITARITGRSDLGPKSSRIAGNLNVMGVAPPMSSVVVERHHPVTQRTVGQATAAKFPRSGQPSSSAGRVSGHSGRSHQIQSIKVVE
ncbi:centrosomal protein POC5-like isoform X2 [Polyodon spathula]|uniref:centrosomal protein POC5-like isoform X2 n=1 Tax=Polyodon spathula TaxID=7913 RepID=UPI001B7ECBE9|nr:centrosomal protein POC5-like isoform X2 [Polyodon spathula]